MVFPPECNSEKENPAIDTVRPAERAQDYSIEDYGCLPVTVDANIDIFLRSCTMPALYCELEQVKKRGGSGLLSLDGARQTANITQSFVGSACALDRRL